MRPLPYQGSALPLSYGSDAVKAWAPKTTQPQRGTLRLKAGLRKRADTATAARLGQVPVSHDLAVQTVQVGAQGHRRPETPAPSRIDPPVVMSGGWRYRLSAVGGQVTGLGRRAGHGHISEPPAIGRHTAAAPMIVRYNRRLAQVLSGWPTGHRGVYSQGRQERTGTEIAWNCACDGLENEVVRTR